MNIEIYVFSDVCESEESKSDKEKEAKQGSLEEMTVTVVDQNVMDKESKEGEEQMERFVYSKQLS